MNLNYGQGQQSYVPKIEDQNILFYSLHPKDTISRQFLAELNKNQLLDKQFIKICVFPKFQNIRIPQKIIQLNKVPVLVAAGFPEPILGEDALSWLRNNALDGGGPGGLDTGNLGDNSFSAKFANLDEEFKATDYNQFFNSEYNLGFGQGDQNSLTNPYSGIKDPHGINTYDDGFESKKGISDMMAKRMNQLRFQRDKDVPMQRPRLGGFEQDQHQGHNITDLMNTPMGGQGGFGNQMDPRMMQQGGMMHMSGAAGGQGGMPNRPNMPQPPMGNFPGGMQPGGRMDPRMMQQQGMQHMSGAASGPGGNFPGGGRMDPRMQQQSNMPQRPGGGQMDPRLQSMMHMSGAAGGQGGGGSMDQRMAQMQQERQQMMNLPNRPQMPNGIQMPFRPEAGRMGPHSGGSFPAPGNMPGAAGFGNPQMSNPMGVPSRNMPNPGFGNQRQY